MVERNEPNTSRARQTRPGRPVLYVLIGGLALCALFIIGMLAFPSAGTTPPSLGIVNNAQTGSVQKEVPPSTATQTTPGSEKTAH